MGKAFDFVSRIIGEIKIILALVNLCTQAGQMLYPNERRDGKLFRARSQFFFTQPGDTKMLAEVFDCVSEGGGGIVDANGEDSVDDAEG
ncbi:MAG: hypothetical protein CVU41_18100 [Chloroflexi bacterium HGW-Chloroflexi-3]|nr:MAG: hypothetical protein CVU41_18100 [Chloroflexi bacterium HGW-Chloroflexi-3]